MAFHQAIIFMCFYHQLVMISYRLSIYNHIRLARNCLVSIGTLGSSGVSSNIIQKFGKLTMEKHVEKIDDAHVEKSEENHVF